MNLYELDTPSLLFDREIMLKNLRRMQSYAAAHGVALRPHTKTHKTPALAKLQVQMGAAGIAVAKVGEAEVMAENGLGDIFIANEIVGRQKLERIARLQTSAKISFGVDSPCQIEEAEAVFAVHGLTAEVLIEIEVGENRSGIIRTADFLELLETLRSCPHVHLKGVFSHDGNSYDASTQEAAREGSVMAQRRTLDFAMLAERSGFPLETVSIGSTPSQANGADILPGVTEIRPGTYILMDASQGHAVGDMTCCAATVLATVMSRPTEERVILDVGAKGLTMQSRSTGICATPGLGTILEYPDVHIRAVYDEHAIVYDQDFHDAVQIGDKVRIIPVHICPVCNLYDRAYLVSGGEVVEELPILCRGRLQ